MSERPRTRAVSLALSIVPGWGHIHHGREGLGLAIFTAFAVVGFAWINGRFIYRGEGRELLLWIGGGAAVAIWLAAFVELWLRSAPARVERDKTARARFLLQGMIAYLKGDWAAAEVDFRGALKLEPQDVEALFRLGMTLLRKAEEQGGDVGPALRVLRKARRFDLSDKWTWEIERELERLSPRRSRRSGAGRASDGEEDPTDGSENADPRATSAPEEAEAARA